MDRKKYIAVYEKLKKPGDRAVVSKRYNISNDVLSAILGQKIVRTTKKRYHVINKNISQFSRRWSRGESILKISEEAGFSPVMMTSLILQDTGLARNDIRKYLNDPEAAENPRLRRELAEVLRHEFVYSPRMTALQKQRGDMVEEKVRKWLESRNAGFIDERGARGVHAKTPDFLLNHGLKIDGNGVKWIECKASFGDDYEIQRDYKKQLSHYAEMFGPGMAVYWYGFLRDKELKDIILKSRSFFD